MQRLLWTVKGYNLVPLCGGVELPLLSEPAKANASALACWGARTADDATRQ